MPFTEKSAPAPRLRLEEYFNGRCSATGIFQDRFGTLRRRFDADIQGAFDGETLTLTEDFIYDDGETEHRVWHINPVGAHGYEGRCGDVIGAARGAAAGPTLSWRYRFSLPIGGRRIMVSFDDRFFLAEDGVLINRAKVRKFGLLLGEATIVFYKAPAARPAAAGESPRHLRLVGEAAVTS